MNATVPAGGRIVAGNVIGTGLFVVTAVAAAVFFTTALQWVGAITALTLFAVGVFCFLWSYVQAVQRSRSDEISVTSLYLLTGPASPAAVKRPMLALLAIQAATAVATTFVRLEGPDGEPGSSLAVGFLVPMLGFGLNGLWAARHGAFPSRRRVIAAAEADNGVADDHADADDGVADDPDDDGTGLARQSLPEASVISQNGAHG